MNVNPVSCGMPMMLLLFNDHFPHNLTLTKAAWLGCEGYSAFMFFSYRCSRFNTRACQYKQKTDHFQRISATLWPPSTISKSNGNLLNLLFAKNMTNCQVLLLRPEDDTRLKNSYLPVCLPICLLIYSLPPYLHKEEKKCLNVGYIIEKMPDRELLQRRKG